GVMKDINEFFDPRAKPPTQRWHYQYAVFSATGFSEGAEAYAYAHDIYPVPLAHVAAIAPIVAEIQEVDEVLARHIDAPLSRLRSGVRSSFGRALPPQMPGVEWDVPDRLVLLIDSITTQLTQLGGALLARMTSGLPLFLVPPDRHALE